MNKKLVLLAIDDEQDILYTLQVVGQTMGWRVYTENDGEAAVRKLAEIKPDIIIVDYHMPNQDGLTTVRAIRALDKAVPIIVLTVDENQQVADRFLDAGASDFANKPVRLPDLIARIRVHMQLRQHRADSDNYFVDKGINASTLERIRVFCRSIGKAFYIEDVVESLGMAYPTAVRYLQYLQTRRELVIESDYGKVGRPRNRYRYNVK